jgi:hypothetical protein
LIELGDSGGPILQWIGDRWEQVGISSYVTYGCAAVGFPPVFTRLAYYNDWIESILNEDHHTSTAATTSGQTITYECDMKKVTCGCGIYDVLLTSSTIVGGEEAPLLSWPMIVSLRFNGTNKHSCVGTVLSHSHILTAAHCVENKSPWGISVVSGETDFSTGTEAPKIYQVDRIHVHFDYKDRTNDIAILHLTSPLNIAEKLFTAPTCLPRVDISIDVQQYPLNGTRLAMVGWRIMQENNSITPDMVQQAEVFVIDDNHPMCANLTIDSEKQFCAGNYRDGKGKAFFSSLFYKT